MAKKKSQIAYLVFLLLSAPFHQSCSVSSDSLNNASSIVPNQDTNQPLQDETNNKEEWHPYEVDHSEKIKQAWKLFTKNGRYRMANPNDFTTIARKHLDQNIGIYLPLLFDINLDGGFDDIAVIIVDTQQNDKQFGLIIFSSPKNQAKYSVTWVFQNRDLSQTILSRASARLVLTTYFEDGSSQSCNMKLNKQLARYFCEDM
jgi:hypothetical protein